MILFSLFITSCTDLNNSDEDFVIDAIENTIPGKTGGGGDGSTECTKGC